MQRCIKKAIKVRIETLENDLESLLEQRMNEEQCLRDLRALSSSSYEPSSSPSFSSVEEEEDKPMVASSPCFSVGSLIVPEPVVLKYARAGGDLCLSPVDRPVRVSAGLHPALVQHALSRLKNCPSLKR